MKHHAADVLGAGFVSMHKIFKGLTALVGALAGFVPAAHGQDFESLEAARTYLNDNPTGPLAEQAFRQLVDANLAGSYPEFPRDTVDPGATRTIQAGSGLGSDEVAAALAAAALAGASTTGGPSAEDTTY